MPQGDCDDEREEALDRRRQPLDHAKVTGTVPCFDQEPARQAGEIHGHRRAAVDTQDPSSRRRAPSDKYGPDRCRDHAAHREREVARRRARGRFRWTYSRSRGKLDAIVAVARGPQAGLIALALGLDFGTARIAPAMAAPVGMTKASPPGPWRLALGARP
ncbi:MAG TPA: hypothetical protein VGH53_15885 [Streptosporangiaceae bacterium]